LLCGILNTAMTHFNKVTIIGVGLIGGSLAKVLRTSGLADSIIGSGRSRETLELALRLGVIDQIGQGPKEAVEGADLVVLASPVGTFEDVVGEIGPHLKTGAILTDVGSVKGKLVHRIEEILPTGIHFVPCHPIAGKEKFGVSEATDTLFRGAKCILTPTDRTETAAVNALREVWAKAGANVIIMDPDLHDTIFAAVSHMPHVAAFAMMCAVAELNTGTDDYLNFSGAGFKDFTRIAASSPEIWRDICIMNRDNVVQMLDRFLFSLNRLKQDLVANNAEKFEKHLKIASDARRGLG
jgi:prephenate dehydrogenase